MRAIAAMGRSYNFPSSPRTRGPNVLFGCSAPLRRIRRDFVSPLGESLLSDATKGTKKACPVIRAR